MATNTTNFNLSKPAYTDTADIAVVNSNMDKVDTSLQGLATGLAIISNANTHVAITSGQYVYVHGHGSLAEGLYTAKSNISANATLSTSNLQAVSGGGLNALNSNLSNLIEGNLLPANSNLLDAPVGEWSYVSSLNLTNTPCTNGLVRVFKTSSSTQWKMIVVNDPVNAGVTYINIKTSSWSGWKQLALNDKITIIDYTGTNYKTTTTGYFTIPYPAGMDQNSHIYMLAPEYLSGGLAGYSYTVQRTTSNIVVYIRAGTDLPQDNSKVAFKLVCIKV